MVVDPDNIKIYRCANWTEGTTHGGGIDTGNEIPDATPQNVFDNVTDQERIDGDTEYRKVFFRNENADNWANLLGKIDSNTPATNTNITILAGGSKSKQSEDSDALSGTFIFTNGGSSVTASTDISQECRPGEKIFNSDDDINTSAIAIASISSDGLTITLASNYNGTGGSGKTAKLAPITASSFVTPDSYEHADALVLGSLAEDEYIAVWHKRTVSAGGNGYDADNWTIKVKSS